METKKIKVKEVELMYHKVFNKRNGDSMKCGILLELEDGITAEEGYTYAQVELKKQLDIRGISLSKELEDKIKNQKSEVENLKKELGGLYTMKNNFKQSLS
jgi:uncharacterized membrane protein YjjP (DUF1212 family)